MNFYKECAKEILDDTINKVGISEKYLNKNAMIEDISTILE